MTKIALMIVFCLPAPSVEKFTTVARELISIVQGVDVDSATLAAKESKMFEPTLEIALNIDKTEKTQDGMTVQGTVRVSHKNKTRYRLISERKQITEINKTINDRKKLYTKQINSTSSNDVKNKIKNDYDRDMEALKEAKDRYLILLKQTEERRRANSEDVNITVFIPQDKVDKLDILRFMKKKRVPLRIKIADFKFKQEVFEQSTPYKGPDKINNMPTKKPKRKTNRNDPDHEPGHPNDYLEEGLCLDSIAATCISIHKSVRRK